MANKVELIFGADQVRTTSQVISDLQTIAKKIEASGATRLKFSIDTKGIEDAGGAIQKNVKAFSLTNVANESKKAMSAATAEMTRARIATQNVKTETERLVGVKKIEAAATNAAIAKKRLEAVVQRAVNKETKKTEKNTRANVNAQLQYNRVLDQSRNYYERYGSSIRKKIDLNKKWQNLIVKLQDPKKYFKSQTDARAEMVSLSRETREAGLQVETLRNKLQRLFGIHLSTALTMVGIHLLIKSFNDMVTSVTELDSKFTQFKIVTQTTDSELVKFGNDAAKVAEQIGSSISDIVEASTVFARLGFSSSQSLDLSKLTTIYSKVADVDISDAESNITTIVKAFDVSTDQLQSVLDKMTYVGNSFPVSSKQLGIGLQNAGSALKAGGNSLEQSISLLTAAMSQTQDIDKSSTGLRTISARIRNSKTELENLGESISNEYNTTAKYRKKLLALTEGQVDIIDDSGTAFRSTYDIIKSLSSVWGKLNDVDQAAITTMIAGVRQQNIFAGLLNSFGEATKVMDTMSNSTGALQKAQETYIDSIQGKIGQFKATFQELSTTVADSDVLKSGIVGGTKLISVLNQLFSIGNGFLPKVTLLLATEAALTKARKALNLSYTKSTGRHKMICLINMPVNDLVVTRNELVA